MIVDKYGRVAGSIDLAALAQMYAQSDDDDLRVHYREVAAESGVDLDAGGSEVAAVVAADTAGAVSDVSEFGAEAPPRSGAGSGRDAWVAYAASRGVEVTDDMTRDEIIEAVDEED